jgi:hypothetical protein
MYYASFSVFLNNIEAYNKQHTHIISIVLYREPKSIQEYTHHYNNTKLECGKEEHTAMT